MSLRINHNIAAVNGHRNMIRNDAAISKSLERLSSGLRINRAADDAAGLVISEQMRAQITGLDQAIANSETAMAMVQTAEGALDEINALLTKSRQLVLHAANEGTNDINQILADQKELDNAIASIDRIADQTQFGTKRLLDGSLAGAQNYDTSVIHKFDVGDGLMARSDFSGDPQVTLSITAGGTATTISGFAGSVGADVATLGSYMAGGGSALGFTATGGSLSSLTSFFASNAHALAEGASLSITVDGVGYTYENQESVSDIISQINGNQQTYDLGVATTGLTASRGLLGVGGGASDLVVSARTGTKPSAEQSGTPGTGAVSGVAGSTVGNGTQTIASLTGLEIGGTDTVVNLVADLEDASILRSTAYGIEIDVTNAFAGTAGNTTTTALTKGALFQIGANAEQLVAVDLKSVRTTQLGLGGDSRDSARLQTLSSLSAQQALVNGEFKGAIEVIDKSIDDITNLRGQLGAFQANSLESGINSLRITHENLTSAESTIRDVDFAAESALFTRNNIMMQASTSMLAQANQLPQNVLQLLQ